MNTTENPIHEEPDKANLPRWMVLSIALFFWVMLLPLVYAGIPWALSLLMPRYRWVDSRPVIWNLSGLILITLATICIIWLMILHFSRMPKRVQLERTPRYLLMSGPYKFTRNPMYVVEIALLFG